MASVVHTAHKAPRNSENFHSAGVFNGRQTFVNEKAGRHPACRRTILVFVLAMVIGMSLPTPAQAGQSGTGKKLKLRNLSQNTQYVPGEVLVLVSTDVNDVNRNGVVGATEDLQGVEAAVRGTVKRRILFAPRRRHGKQQRRKLQHLKQQVLQVKLPQGKSVKEALAEKWGRKDSRILAVEPNYRLRTLAVPNDPRFIELWALNNTGQTRGTARADIDAIRAWEITTGSPDVVVAVVDTGIDYLHPDLADNMWVNTGEVPNNGIDDDENGYIDDVHGYDFVQDDGDPYDEHSHGTHCAGTIAARGNNDLGITGVNWQCKVMACRFLNASGSGYTVDAIDAINYAVANGADILNNSWGGGGYSAALKAAIINARDQGVLFVAAAGNLRADNDVSPHYPSSYEVSNVIAVAATNHSDGLAGFSCYGSESVHLGAPGVSILSTILNEAYTWHNGTSMATPHVAGVAALLLANDPDMSLEELKSRIVYTGDPIGSLDGKTISGRRLNAYNALTAEPGIEIFEPNGGESWVQGFTWQIKWMSIGGGPTVDIYLLKGGLWHTQLADNVPNEGIFAWDISESLPPDSNYSILIDDGISTDESSGDFTITDEWTDYFTEVFSEGVSSFDVSNKSVLLIPDGSSGYDACARDITELPTDPAGGVRLPLSDDDSEPVTLAGESVLVYGHSYATFYVGSNGYITFESGDNDYTESLEKHFRLKRISGLFDDLNPSSGGMVSWKQLVDRAVVSWENVPEYGYGRGNSNTFQIEMYFDGQIRLSWLSVAAQDGIAGLSEGLGLPADFQNTDLSGYAQCEVELDLIEISGPNQVDENSGAQYTCTAHYEDGSTEDITSSATVTWSDNSDYASIDGSGYLTTSDVNAYQQCTITVSCDGKSDAQSVIIKGDGTEISSLQLCKVRAGRIDAQDSIKCSGTFGATGGQIASANKIDVKIWSADDYLVYSESIDFNPDSISKGKYTYKRKVRKDEPGAITSFKFDMNKRTFSLQARKVDLTGLGSPLFVNIEIGDYIGLAEADEETINGKRLIPIQLMSEYADTLRVDKVRVKSGKSVDLLSVKGALASDSIFSGDVTVTWGPQTFTVPAYSFYIKRGYMYSEIEIPESTIIRAKFDFDKCSLMVVIKKAGIWPKSGTVDFGIAFDGYNETVEVDL